jgi:predicted kinase
MRLGLVLIIMSIIGIYAHDDKHQVEGELMNFVHHRVVRAALLLLASTAVVAQEVDRPSLRERLRERIEQRREPASDASAAGTTEYSLRHGGLTRKYLLHVPSSATRANPAPGHRLSRRWRACGVHGR